MTVKKTVVCMAMVFCLFFFLGASKVAMKSEAPVEAFQKETPVIPTDADLAIQQAFETTVQMNRSQVLGFQIFQPVIDHIDYSSDQSVALVWVALLDPQSGQVVESEPGLTIARSASSAALGSPDNWSFTLQTDSNFNADLESLPAELLTDEVRNRFLEPESAVALSATGPVRGYKLPWTAGLAKRVTNSIGHVYSVSGGYASCPSTCRYAYDFADGTMFPMLAAKGGTVRAFNTICANGSTSCTNYLVLQDESTVPTTYQLYYHMAQNSIPQKLRTIGTQVTQGEYIGDADDTGNSTGHHLHFHVYQTPTGTNWSWGPSVDFIFEDVASNGGYPRTCAEASAYPNLGSQCMANNLYTSGNTPAHPPSASISSPTNRQLVHTRNLQVTGTATDDIAIARIQVLVNYDGTWKSVDEIPAVTGAFSRSVDLCSAGVPNGPMGVTLRVYDREGSQAKNIPVRQVIWDGSCADPSEPPPAPACAPTANQVALYAGKDFQGNCTRFDVSDHAGYGTSVLGAVGDNQAASIQVGSNVRAVLYDKNVDVTAARVTGRMETIAASDPNLADNLIGAGTVSGLWVIARTDLLDAPYINSFSNTTSASDPTSLDSLVFAWEGGSGAVSYDVTLTGPGTNWTKTVAGSTAYSAGNLAAGSYTLTVKANPKNSTVSKSGTKTFSVTSASFPAASTRTAPYQESFETNAGEWTGSGLWRYGTVTMGSRGATKAWVYNDGSTYTTATYRAGDLTSPPITIPAGATYYLRFQYFADVESGNPYFDQRRLQISDGGPFTDVYQFSDDKQPVQDWLYSGPINLSAYAGKTIRLRFHFDTVDEENNSGAGWMIDNLSINTTGPITSCADSDRPDQTAPAVSLGGSVIGVICPEGDIDYYRLSLAAGQILKVDVNARNLSPASQLDSYIYLLDADGRSVLAENDDEAGGSTQDSMLTYTIRRDGTYYLKLKPWDYPGAGGSNHYYQVLFSEVAARPPQEVKITFPPENRMTPTIPFNITASAVDFGGGQAAQVSFYWHGPDWSKAEWVKLGTDTDASNGWSYPVNPAQYGGVQGSAVYIQAVSQTGGILGAVLWDLLPDNTTPVSQLASLPAQTNSSVAHLVWTASDVQGDIDRFELQYQSNSGGAWSGWQNWTERSLPGNLTATWFVGTPGVSYRFRLHAIDRAGNVETYPDMPEAITTFAASCTPDSAEPQGGSADSAVPVPGNKASGLYNLCSTAQPGVGDVDWIAMNLVKGENLVMLMSKGGGAAFTVKLYNVSRQVVQTAESVDYGSGLSIRFNAPASGTYYLEIKPLKAVLFGTDARYQVWYGEGHWNYFPLVNN